MPEVDQETVFNNYQPVTSKVFAISLLVEFIGVLIFSFLGTTVDDKVFGPWVNGLALAIMIYTAANISGGHLNPAVTISTLMCGFYPVLHSVLYICLQILGAIFGSLLAAALLPGKHVGMGNGGPGCFDETTIHADLTRDQLFGWEVVMTFTLISVVYACGIAKPGHGSFTPLVVGLSLVACAGTGGKYTGAALNPARVIGPLAVFGCGSNIAYVFILAEILAAVLACSIFVVVSGWGPLSPWQARKQFNLKHAEAVRLYLTGQPPARFRDVGDENVTDMMTTMSQASSDAPNKFSKSLAGIFNKKSSLFTGKKSSAHAAAPAEAAAMEGAKDQHDVAVV
eukprot:gene7751-7950_t